MRASPLLIAAACLAVGLGATYAEWRSKRADVQDRLETYFSFRIRDAERRLSERMRNEAEVLRGLAGHLTVATGTGPDGFARYAATLDLPSRHPGIRAVGFLRAGPDGGVPPLPALLLAAPGADGPPAFDAALLDTPGARAAMDRARDLGEPSLSGPVARVEERDGVRGSDAFLFAPVFAAGASPATPEARRRDLSGWAFAFLRLPEVLAGALGERGADLDVSIHDGDRLAPESLVFDDGLPAAPTTRRARLEGEKPIQVGGRTWVLAARSTGEFEARRGYEKDRLVATFGAALSLLVALLAWTLATGLSRTREALRRSRTLQAAVIDSIPDALWYAGDDGGLTPMNPAAHRADGAPELGGDSATTRALHGELVRDEEQTYRLPGSTEERHRLLTATPVVDAQGNIVGAVTIARDVTARKLRERLGAARARLQELALHGTLPRLLTAVLDEAEALTGSRIGFLHLVEPDEETLRLQAWSTRTTSGMCAADGAGQHYPLSRAGVWADAVRLRRPVVHDDYPSLPDRKGMPAGHAEVTRLAVVPLLREGKVRAVVGVGNKASPYRDVDVEVLAQLAEQSWPLAERLQAEEALRASEARFRALAEDSPVGIHESDALGRSVYMNRAALRILGLPASLARGNGWQAAIHPADRRRAVARWEAACAAGEDVAEEFRILGGDRSVRVVRAHTHPLRGNGDGSASGGAIRGFVGVFVDLTEQRALEQRLSVASRLAAVGTLVAGVAHEINNPLAAALASESYAAEEVGRLRELLRSGGAIDRDSLARALDDLVEALRDARDGSERIARIVKDLSVFGRQESLRNRVQLREVVDRALRWIPTALAARAEIRVEDGGAPAVLGSEGQLGQVLVNIVSNAAKAIPAERRGAIAIRLGAGSPGMARVEVSDDGAGMSPEVLERIFDPFFTTREVGKGMGLGLPVCHAIVSAHGGTITVASAPGEGSTFRIELPVAVPEPAPDRGAQADPAS